MSSILFSLFEDAATPSPAPKPVVDLSAIAPEIVGGEDIWFDVSAELADYIVTPAGDWLSVSGLRALRQSLVRRTITNPGEWKTKPNYGVGARQYVKAKDTPSMRSELEARIRSQYLIDRRVERVDQVVIGKTVDGIGPILRINVQYTPLARLRTDQPQKILIDLR